MNRIYTKLTLLFCAISITIGMASCETQAEKEAKAKAAQPAKYTISIGQTGTTFADVIVYECDASGDRIYENNCRFKWDEKTPKTYTAQPGAKKLKVYVSFNNGSDLMSFGSVAGWVQVAYPLNHGETTDVKVDGYTSLGRNMP